MATTIATNNFDLIRLFAATQVAVLHLSEYLLPSERRTTLQDFLSIFPGVPIFFFISGFLITRSFERNNDVRQYARNRALRIFPALHVCVAINLLFVFGSGYLSLVGATASDVIRLYIAKTTIFQFYNPQFMRQFGDGVLNGSLWTICVELQFYFLVPIIYRFFVSTDGPRNQWSLFVLLIASLLVNRALYYFEADYRDLDAWKLLRVSFLPWIYMFLTGMLVQRNWTYISSLLERRGAPIGIAAYVLIVFYLQSRGVVRLDNAVSPLIFFPLAAVTVIASYSRPRTSAQLLSGNDISYGIYIYHAPIMNMYLFYGVAGSMAFWQCLLLTLVFAVSSWFAIERPSLRRKRHPLHAISA